MNPLHTHDLKMINGSNFSLQSLTATASSQQISVRKRRDRLMPPARGYEPLNTINRSKYNYAQNLLQFNHYISQNLNIYYVCIFDET